MKLLMLKKPEDVSIEQLIDFFDEEFKGMGFEQGSRCEDSKFVEVLYTTQQSGCVRVKYSRNRPFRVLSVEQMMEFDVSFEFIQVSEVYQKKLMDSITAGRTY